MSKGDGAKQSPDPLKPADEGLFDMMAFDDQPTPSPLAGEAPAETAASSATLPEAEEEPKADKKKRKKEKRKKDKKERAPREPAAEVEGAAVGSWLDKLQHASPYNVMLAVSLGAIVFGVLLLVLEWGAYGFRGPGR